MHKPLQSSEDMPLLILVSETVYAKLNTCANANLLSFFLVFNIDIEIYEIAQIVTFFST